QCINSCFHGPVPSRVSSLSLHVALPISRAGAAEGHFNAIYEFYCQVPERHGSAAPAPLSRVLYAPPQPGDCLESEPLIESDHARSEEHTSELQSLRHLVCRLLLEKKNQS